MHSSGAGLQSCQASTACSYLRAVATMPEYGEVYLRTMLVVVVQKELVPKNNGDGRLR